MNPSWVVIAGGSSLSVSPPQRKVSVPVAPEGFADPPGCATGAQAATIVAAPAARSRWRRVIVETLIFPIPPPETAGSIAPPDSSLGHSDAEQEAVLLDGGARHEKEDDPIRGRGDRHERFAQQIDHLAHRLAGGNSVANSNRASEEALRRRAQPLEPIEHA